MIKKFLRGLLYAEWNNHIDDNCRAKLKLKRRNLSDIYSALDDINFTKKGMGNDILSVKYIDGVFSAEHIVKVGGVLVFGVTTSTTGYYWSEYVDDQELIQETLDEVYFIMDKLQEVASNKDRQDASRAKAALRKHKKARTYDKD